MGRGPAWARVFASHTLTNVTDATGDAFAGEVAGPSGSAGMWLFPVVDDHTRSDGLLMMSMVVADEIYTGTLDLSAIMGGTGSGYGDVSVLGAIVWEDLGVTNPVTDHWHIFAFGYHWVSYNVDSTNDVYLVRVSVDPLTGERAIVDEILVYSESSSSAVYYNTGVTFATNDHFLVEVPGGIALALCSHTDHTLQVIIVEASSPGTLYAGPISFGGGSSHSSVAMNTTGSARPASPGGIGPMPDWQVLVPDIISPTTFPNNLHLMSTDRDFSSASVASTLRYSGYALQMATFDRLVNGEYIVAYKRVPTGLYYSDGSSVISDNGDIILEVYDSALTSADVTVECLIASHSALGNRPHMVRWDRYVITCWDQAELDPKKKKKKTKPATTTKLSGVYLRIDFLTGVL